MFHDDGSQAPAPGPAPAPAPAPTPYPATYPATYPAPVPTTHAPTYPAPASFAPGPTPNFGGAGRTPTFSGPPAARPQQPRPSAPAPAPAPTAPAPLPSHSASWAASRRPPAPSASRGSVVCLAPSSYPIPALTLSRSLLPRPLSPCTIIDLAQSHSRWSSDTCPRAQSRSCRSARVRVFISAVKSRKRSLWRLPQENF
jgi:hypothetical protein